MIVRVRGKYFWMFHCMRQSTWMFHRVRTSKMVTIYTTFDSDPPKK